MFCQNCGQNLSDDAKFCENCGALTPPQPQSPIPQQTTPPQGGYQQSVQQPVQQPIQQPVQQGYPQSAPPPQYIYQQPVAQTGYQPVGGYPQQPYPLKPPLQKKKSKALPIIAVLVVLALLVIGGIAVIGFIGNNKDITNIQMASKVDESTFLPITKTSVFYTDTPQINCTLLSKLPIGSMISAEWVYLGSTSDSITSDYTTQHSPEQINFSLTMPDAGWTAGKYEVRISIEGKAFKTVRFEVKKSTGTTSGNGSPTPAVSSNKSGAAELSMIKNVQTASQINESTLEPLDKQSAFSTTAPIIYVTFSINNAPVGAAVHLEWIYTTTKEQAAIWDANTTQASQNAQCGLTKPDAGWKVGNYEVRISLNGVYVTSAQFSVK